MYLLNLKIAKKLKLFPEFTFHYVSIKSSHETFVLINSEIFTFHYVSIKSTCNYTLLELMINLHSTMYLLNHSQSQSIKLSIYIYIPLCIY